MVKESDYIFANQEILGGIKSAITRGENLKEAMMTFYQAGYDKAEIEEAAKAYLNEGGNSAGSEINSAKRIQPTHSPEKKESLVALAPLEKNSEQKEKTKNIQKVSNYVTPKKLEPVKGEGLTIILIVVLLLLLGILAAVFLFKDELVTFFNGLFG